MTEAEKQNAQSGVYCISIGDKFYIGSTPTFSNRMYEHYRKLKNGRHINPAMQKAFDETGLFGAEVIEYCEPQHLSDLENKYIQQWFGHQDCLNRNKQTKQTRMFSDEQAEQIRKRHAAGESQSAIARSLGCSQATIHEVIHFKGPYMKEEANAA